MISCFPTPYPDELFYSTLARYYKNSGYMAYTFVAEDLYVRNTIKPSIEFINELSSEALEVITKITPLNRIIEKHTMFPYYARFLPKERRNNAYMALMNMDEAYHNYICMSKNKKGEVRYLRYCSVCALTDREKYGEAYWHRSHQMIGVDICPIHHCDLKNSQIIISSKSSPSLINAEESIPKSETISEYKDEVLCSIAEYVYNVFQSNFDYDSDVDIGSFLHSKMENTKYVSLRGEQRNMSILHSDFCNYYKSLTDNNFNQQWQLQKIFTNDRFNTYEICLVAMFLNVLVSELINMKLPKKRQQEIFDEKINAMHKQGLNYSEISKQLNASYDVVKSIGEGRYGMYHCCSQSPKKSGTNKLDWNKIDNETLPQVREVLKQLCYNNIDRPQKISIRKIENILSIPKNRLLKCPKCKTEIEKYIETQEEYWAREVVWAVNKILKEDRPLNMKRIRELTNIRKKNLLDCVQYIDKYDNSGIKDKMKVLLDIT